MSPARMMWLSSSFRSFPDSRTRRALTTSSSGSGGLTMKSASGSAGSSPETRERGASAIAGTPASVHAWAYLSTSKDVIYAVSISASAGADSRLSLSVAGSLSEDRNTELTPCRRSSATSSCSSRGPLARALSKDIGRPLQRFYGGQVYQTQTSRGVGNGVIESRRGRRVFRLFPDTTSVVRPEPVEGPPVHGSTSSPRT